MGWDGVARKGWVGKWDRWNRIGWDRTGWKWVGRGGAVKIGWGKVGRVGARRLKYHKTLGLIVGYVRTLGISRPLGS